MPSVIIASRIQFQRPGILIMHVKDTPLLAISSTLTKRKTHFITSLSRSLSRVFFFRDQDNIMTLTSVSLTVEREEKHHLAARPSRNPERLALMLCAAAHIQGQSPT